MRSFATFPTQVAFLLLVTLLASATAAQDASQPEPRPGELWTLAMPGAGSPSKVRIVELRSEPDGVGSIVVARQARKATGKEVSLVIESYLAPVLHAALRERLETAGDDAPPPMPRWGTLRFALPGVEPGDAIDRSEPHAEIRAGQVWAIGESRTPLLVVGTGRAPGGATIVEFLLAGRVSQGGNLVATRVLETTFRAAAAEKVRDQVPVPEFDPGACVVHLRSPMMLSRAVGVAPTDPGAVLELHQPQGDIETVDPYVVWGGRRLDLEGFAKVLDGVRFGTCVDIRPQRNVRYVDVASVVDLLVGAGCCVQFWATRTDVLEVRMIDDGPRYGWRDRDLDLAELRAAIAGIETWPAVTIRADATTPVRTVSEVMDLFRWSGCEKIELAVAHGEAGK